MGTFRETGKRKQTHYPSLRHCVDCCWSRGVDGLSEVGEWLLLLLLSVHHACKVAMLHQVKKVIEKVRVPSFLIDLNFWCILTLSFKPSISFAYLWLLVFVIPMFHGIIRKRCHALFTLVLFFINMYFKVVDTRNRWPHEKAKEMVRGCMTKWNSSSVGQQGSPRRPPFSRVSLIGSCLVTKRTPIR